MLNMKKLSRELAGHSLNVLQDVVRNLKEHGEALGHVAECKNVILGVRHGLILHGCATHLQAIENDVHHLRGVLRLKGLVTIHLHDQVHIKTRIKIVIEIVAVRSELLQSLFELDTKRS